MTRKYATCWRKVRYVTKAEAQEAVRRLMERKGAFGLGAYECEYCKDWHVGHPKEQDWKMPDRSAPKNEPKTLVYIGKHKVPFDKLRKRNK